LAPDGNRARPALRLRGSKYAVIAGVAALGTVAAKAGRLAGNRGSQMSTSIERSSVEGDRTLAVAAYVLHLAGAVVGLTSLVGLVINYVKRDDYDELFDSHHAWMIRSFWWALFWCVIGFVTMFILIGGVILFAVWVWYIYRHVRGLIALINGEPMPY
jgi:uncharacterized membrane protein